MYKSFPIFHIIIIVLFLSFVIFALMAAQYIPNNVFVIDEDRKDHIYTNTGLRSEKFSPKYIAQHVSEGDIYFEGKRVSFNANIIKIITLDKTYIEIETDVDNVIFIIESNDRYNYNEGQVHRFKTLIYRIEYNTVKEKYIIHSSLIERSRELVKNNVDN